MPGIFSRAISAIKKLVVRPNKLDPQALKPISLPRPEISYNPPVIDLMPGYDPIKKSDFVPITNMPWTLLDLKPFSIASRSGPPKIGDGTKAEESLFSTDQLNRINDIDLSALPKTIQDRIVELINDTNIPIKEKRSEKKKRCEYAALLIELPNGELIGSTDNKTSKSENSIESAEIKLLERFAVTEAKQHLREDPANKKGKIKVFFLHTHPEDQSYNEHWFTSPSLHDCIFADKKFFKQFAARLRRAGFKGKIELQELIVPVVQEPLPENSNIHIAVYTENLPPLIMAS